MRRDFLRILEAAIVGLFLVQSIRYLYATLYAHASSADLVRVANPARLDGLPGVVEIAMVQREIWAVIATLLAPLLALVLVRTRWSIPLTVAVCVIARWLTLQLPESSVLAAAVVVAAGLLYLTLIMVRRPGYFPVMLAAGFAGDQIIRALNSTADPSFDASYRFLLLGQVELSTNLAMLIVAIFMVFWTAITTLVEREESRLPGFRKAQYGVLTGWGALALGGLLYLEFTLLGLPNAIARWSGLDYYVMLPLVLTATLLPLVPEVRAQAGRFLAIFDGAYRGWLWAMLLVLLIVIGRRFEGLPAALALTVAQFLAILTLWWLVVQPEERPALNPTPILVLVGAAVFLVLSVGYYFSFDYAYVRPIAAPFTFIEQILAGMRGMGLPLALVAAVLGCLPMILERKIIPWREGKVLETLAASGLVLLVIVGATRAAAPPQLRTPANVDCLRIASLNIHGGYTEFYAPNLEMVADLLLRSGADVILLQEVEAGLLTSGSTDQALWLAEKLNMNVSFFPQNEELEGLAVLSRLNIAEEEGLLLTSPGAQAAVQYVSYRLDDTGDLHIYNAWLNYPLESRDGQPVDEFQQDQRVQMDELYNLVAANHFARDGQSSDRVVMGGSLNIDESSPLYTLWDNTVFDDPFQTLFAERRNTIYRVDGKASRWDYLWLLNLTSSGITIDQDSIVSNRRMSVVAVGREANTGCASQ